MGKRDFLSIDDLSSDELSALIDGAVKQRPSRPVVRMKIPLGMRPSACASVSAEGSDIVGFAPIRLDGRARPHASAILPD